MASNPASLACLNACSRGISFGKIIEQIPLMNCGGGAAAALRVAPAVAQVVQNKSLRVIWSTKGNSSIIAGVTCPARARFSSRLRWNLNPNPLARLIAEKRAESVPILDLTASNPTQAGLEYPADKILEALAMPGALRYEPNPAGLLRAREAVSRYYSGRVSPDRILLTASTSEAYGSCSSCWPTRATKCSCHVRRILYSSFWRSSSRSKWSSTRSCTTTDG